MENADSINSSPSLRCDACFAITSTDAVYCGSCGYPIKGSALEQQSFLSLQRKVDFDLVAFKKRLKNAGYTLYYLAGYFIFISIVTLILSINNPDVLAIVIPNIILAIVFLVLGGYCDQKPLACFVSGLCLYIIVQIFDYVYYSEQISLLYIVKIVIVTLLIRGIKSALEIEKIKKENNIA